MTLNIKEVTLYQSGVGFFMATCPNKQFTLPINEKDINDVLKSLNVNGLESARFSSAEEMHLVTEKLGIVIDPQNALQSICNHLIGLEITLTTDKSYTGIVIGIDEFHDESLVSEKLKNTTSEVIVLKIGDDIKNFAFTDIKSFSLKDSTIHKDIQSYLDLIANKRKSGVVNLFIQTTKPETWATWIMPVSSWRLSYRVFYDTKAKDLDLFGISIIDNTTSIDWDNIVLRLVTGKPISFQYDLFNPLLIKRPEVARDVKGITPMLAEATGAFDDFYPESTEEEFAGGLPGAPPPPPRAAESMRKLASREKMSFETQGIIKSDMDSKETIKPTIETIKLELGSAIAYEVNYPLSILRSQSALIPIINEKKTGDLCVILRDDRLNEAMDALILTKPLDLEKGVATIYLDGIYAGDTMVINGTDFLAFRLNQDLSVMKDTNTQYKIETLTIKGVYMSITESTKTDYIFKFVNRSKDELQLYLEISKQYDFLPQEKPDAESSDYFRYKFIIKTGNSTRKLSFKQTHKQLTKLFHLSQSQLEGYLKSELLTINDRKKLSSILNIKKELQNKEYVLTETQNKINHEFDNQKRLRENIAVTSGDSNLRADYLLKLKESEKQFDSLLDKEKKLRTEIEDLKKKLEDPKA